MVCTSFTLFFIYFSFWIPLLDQMGFLYSEKNVSIFQKTKTLNLSRDIKCINVWNSGSVKLFYCDWFWNIWHEIYYQWGEDGRHGHFEFSSFFRTDSKRFLHFKDKLRLRLTTLKHLFLKKFICQLLAFLFGHWRGFLTKLFA